MAQSSDGKQQLSRQSSPKVEMSPSAVEVPSAVHVFHVWPTPLPCRARRLARGHAHLRRPRGAKAFDATIAAATLDGAALKSTAADPVKALCWSAVVNGVLGGPLMAAMMVIAANRPIMGRLTLPWAMVARGWLATASMALATLKFFFI